MLSSMEFLVLIIGMVSQVNFETVMPDFDQQIAVLQRTIMENTKNYNTRAQPLFRSLNLLFCDVPVAVVGF